MHLVATLQILQCTPYLHTLLELCCVQTKDRRAITARSYQTIENGRTIALYLDQIVNASRSDVLSRKVHWSYYDKIAVTLLIKTIVIRTRAGQLFT